MIGLKFALYIKASVKSAAYKHVHVYFMQFICWCVFWCIIYQIIIALLDISNSNPWFVDVTVSS